MPGQPAGKKDTPQLGPVWCGSTHKLEIFAPDRQMRWHEGSSQPPCKLQARTTRPNAPLADAAAVAVAVPVSVSVSVPFVVCCLMPLVMMLSCCDSNPSSWLLSPLDLPSTCRKRDMDQDQVASRLTNWEELEPAVGSCGSSAVLGHYPL